MTDRHEAKNDLTAEYVRSILDYDPKTGEFRWKVRPDKSARVNTRWAGRIAGTIKNMNGKLYRVITIDFVKYMAHRLAWLYVKGEWPDGDLDHRDCEGLHNAFVNLRPATSTDNGANKRMSRRNTVGYKGVDWRPEKGKYRASMQRNRQWKFLGYFDTPEQAHAAYVAAAKKFHGEFARAG